MDDMKRRALAELEKKSNQLIRAFALQLVTKIVEDTPVDTGRARANWNASVGKPDRRKFDVGEDRGAYAQYLAQQSVENTRQINAANFWNGDVGWIANGLPYILRLEQGSSTQAPAGMVKINIEALRPWLAKQAASMRLV